MKSYTNLIPQERNFVIRLCQFLLDKKIESENIRKSEFASMANVLPNYISALYNPLYHNKLSNSRLELIAGALDIDINNLFDNPEYDQTVKDMIDQKYIRWAEIEELKQAQTFIDSVPKHKKNIAKAEILKQKKQELIDKGLLLDDDHELVMETKAAQVSQLEHKINQLKDDHAKELKLLRQEWESKLADRTERLNHEKAELKQALAERDAAQIRDKNGNGPEKEPVKRSTHNEMVETLNQNGFIVLDAEAYKSYRDEHDKMRADILNADTRIKDLEAVNKILIEEKNSKKVNLPFKSGHITVNIYAKDDKPE